MGSLTVTKIRCGKESHLVDVACSLGRRDRPYLETHSEFAVALVRRGTFRYRAAATNRTHQLRPGWLLFGVAGDTFECSHEHDGGDDCTSLALSASVLDDVSRAAGLCCSRLLASAPALPPLPRAAVLLERARRGGSLDLDELGFLVAESVVAHASSAPLSPVARHPSHARRVHDAIERVEAGCAEELSLSELAKHAQLSPFHFLRVFRHVTGVTPHQYLIGARVRLAARMLLDTERSVTDIAYDVGFNDLSNFMRTFRRVVGKTPRDYRRS